MALLMQAVKEAVKNIANATDLDTAHISSILTENRTATVDSIVHRLREESREPCQVVGNGK